MKRVQEQKTRTSEVKQDVQGEPDSKEAGLDTQQDLKDDLDTLLDEVEAVLEENAEEFVNAYVQKGGE